MNIHDPMSRRSAAGLLLGVGGASLLQACMAEQGTTEDPDLGQSAEPLTGGARIVLASAAGILTTNSAATNTANYAIWRDDSTAAASTLVFDSPGVYWFNPGSGTTCPQANGLEIPGSRKLSGVYGAIIRASGPGDWLVRRQVCTGASPIFIEDLTLDGNGQVGQVLLLGEATGGTGCAAYLNGLLVKGPTTTGTSIAAYNSALRMRDVTTLGGAVGYYVSACSESTGENISMGGCTDYGIRVIGSLGGNGVANGGRMSLFGVSNYGASPLPTYAVSIDGVSQMDIHGLNVAGSTAALQIRNSSTNIRIMGFRTFGGSTTAISFEGCNNALVWGGCLAAQTVSYDDAARGCRAFLAAETNVGHVDVAQNWGAWTGYVRGDGTVLADTAPSAGYWEKGDKIYKKTPASGSVMGWVCSTTGIGTPGNFVAMANLT